MGFCENPMAAYPVYKTYDEIEIGFLKLIIALLYFFMMFVTIGWVKLNEKRAKQEYSPRAVSSVIFPPYVSILWVSALSNAYIGILFMFIPVRINGSDSDASEYLYPIAWSIQHFVIEGIAFMFMQKGCGIGAARRAVWYSFLWAGVTYFLMQLWYSTTGIASITFHLIWSGFMLVFFGCLWLLPEHNLYRRPVAVWYAKFWFLFRIGAVITFAFGQSGIEILEEIGACGYSFGPLMLFPIIQPYVCYRALLDDSLWWKGGFLTDKESPLLGLDFDNHTAQALASVLDHIGSTKAARLLNFAHIQTSWVLLGQGSFSKVYRGSYKRVPCAIKVIFSTDLKEEDINKAAVEATLLSSVKSPNVVDIYGICVNPPNVCMILEICLFGSLSDVLRNGKVTLCYADKMYLALGCCRGLAALHAFSEDLVHRDIKSMNFLVDGQLTAKLADLELGQVESLSEKKSPNSKNTQGFLLNWMPPEFISDGTYTKASDVYALALVLWEIISLEIPFSEYQPEEIRDKVLGECRPLVPDCASQYKDIILRGWSTNPCERQTAKDMEDAMDRHWRSCFYDGVSVPENDAVLRSDVEKFLGCSQGKRYIASLYRDRPGPIAAVPAGQGDMSLSPLTSSRNSIYSDAAPQVGQLWDLFSATSMNGVIEGDDAVVVVSVTAPHLILYCSAAMESLLGFGLKDIFASTFDNYLLPHEHIDRTAESLFNRGSSMFSSEPVRHALPKTFYQDMMATGRAHAVAAVVHTYDGSTTCSISSFPIVAEGGPGIPDEESDADTDALAPSVLPCYYGLLVIPLMMAELSLD